MVHAQGDRRSRGHRGSAGGGGFRHRHRSIAVYRRPVPHVDVWLGKHARRATGLARPAEAGRDLGRRAHRRRVDCLPVRRNLRQQFVDRADQGAGRR